jgi:hypothetical protein
MSYIKVLAFVGDMLQISKFQVWWAIIAATKYATQLFYTRQFTHSAITIKFYSKNYYKKSKLNFPYCDFEDCVTV